MNSIHLAHLGLEAVKMAIEYCKCSGCHKVHLVDYRLPCCRRAQCRHCIRRANATRQCQACGHEYS